MSSTAKPYIAASSATAPQPLRVLLVEDHAADAHLVQHLLDASEDVLFEVTHVTHLELAVALVSKEEFDLVLLDLSLPDGYGSFTIDFAAQFAQRIPVIILTGIEDESLAMNAIHAGAADYICKSALREVHLAKTIECAVERQRRLNLLVGSVSDQIAPEMRDSLHDPITGLMSEALFKDRLEHVLACAERKQEPFAVVALRLNELSEMQSEYAVATLMCSAADCLSRRVRKSDSLARISRDSFGVVISGLSDVAAVNSTVGSLVMSLSSVSLPENSDLPSRDMSTSVGVSIHPDNGCDSSVLLSRAMQFEIATARIGIANQSPQSTF